MKYIKPQIDNLLSASSTIQGTAKGSIPRPDNQSELQFTVAAAYEADE
jgi:hypothetical protein